MIPFVRIREMLADIAERGSSKKSVTNCVEKDVGIRMSQEAHGMRNVHTAEDELPACTEAMDIVSKPYSNVRLRILLPRFHYLADFEV